MLIFEPFRRGAITESYFFPPIIYTRLRVPIDCFFFFWKIECETIKQRNALIQHIYYNLKSVQIVLLRLIRSTHARCNTYMAMYSVSHTISHGRQFRQNAMHRSHRMQMPSLHHNFRRTNQRKIPIREHLEIDAWKRLIDIFRAKKNRPT